MDEVALFEQQRLDPAHGEVAQVPAPVAPPPMTTTSQCRLVYSESSCMDVPVLSGFVPVRPGSASSLNVASLPSVYNRIFT